MNWRRENRDAELERELRSHLDLEAAECVESGASREEARFAAQRALGNTAYIQEDVRSMWGFQWLEVLGQDLRYGARQFARTSAMNAILLRYLPVPNPQQLVYPSATAQPRKAMQSGDGSTSFPEPMFEENRGQRQVFSDLVAFVPLGFSRIPVRIGAVAEEAQVDIVSGNFFSGLGVAVVRGRSFGVEDEKSHAPLAIISDAWRTKRFARDSGVLRELWWSAP